MAPRRRRRDRDLSSRQDPSEPPESTEASLEYFRATITAYRGPLPPVEVLRDLDQLVPGAAERSLTLFEEQARHRMDLERRVVLSDIVQSRLGLGASFALAIGTIAGSMYLIATGHSLEGLGTIITTIVALVGAFAYGTKSRKDERLAKSRRQQELQGPRRRA